MREGKSVAGPSGTKVKDAERSVILGFHLEVLAAVGPGFLAFLRLARREEEREKCASLSDDLCLVIARKLCDSLSGWVS